MSKLTMAGIGMLIFVTGASAAGPNRSAAPRNDAPPRSTDQRQATVMQKAAKKTEQVILGRISAYERELQTAAAQLEKHLAHAESLRQRGLQANDQKLLQQAEQYERRAMAQYEQSIKYFDQRSAQLENNTKSRATNAKTQAPTRNTRPTRTTRQRPNTRPATKQQPTRNQNRQQKRVRSTRRPRWSGFLNQK